MIRVVVAAAIVLLAALVASVLSRRQRKRDVLARFPSSIDLADVGLPRGGVVVFVERACRGCDKALEEVRRSGRPYAIVDGPDARARYGVQEIPTTVEVGTDGVVTRGWLGPLPPGALHSREGTEQ